MNRAPPRLLALVTVLLAVPMAGCVHRSDDAPRENGDPASSPTFGVGTGAVHGVVVNAQQEPLAGAAVTLDGAATTFTETGGEFTFNFVEPGRHQVAVNQTGYKASVALVAVDEGAVARLVVTLESLPSLEAYHETGIKAGMVGCSLAVWQPSNQAAHNQPIGLCVAVEDRFRTGWPIDTLRKVSGLWFETEWRSTQVAGNGFTTFWPFYVKTSSLGYMGVYNGSSPLSGGIGGADFDAYLLKAKQSHDSCVPSGCHYEGWHYTLANTLGNQFPVDFGVQIQQSYQDYSTVFHGSVFPSTFTALPDG